jgi:hypothetical protein
VTGGEGGPHDMAPDEPGAPDQQDAHVGTLVRLRGGGADAR